MLTREWQSAVALSICVVGLSSAGCGSSGDARSSGGVSGPDASEPVPPVPEAVTLSCNQVAPDGIGGVFNVKDYGAKPDGTDAFPGIQSAIDAACATSVGSSLATTDPQRSGPGSGQPPAVYLPAGRYALQRPLSITCNGLEMFGACRDGVALTPKFQGPAVVVSPPVGTIPAGPALLGTGRSATTAGQKWHLDLRDIPAVELQGKPALTVEAFVKLTANPDGSSFIAQSYGCTGGVAFPCNVNGGAFTLGVVSLGGPRPYLSASVTAGGHQVYVGGGPNAANLCPREGGADAWTLSLNEAHHVALTYDGGMVRLFLDGKRVACQAASGVVEQQADETVSVGPYWNGFDMHGLANPITGNIDAVRLSSTARYADDFARPSVNFTDDGDTLALVDFDELPAPPPPPAGRPALTNPPNLTLAHSRGAPFWLPIRSVDTSPAGTVQNVRLHNFTVEGGMGLFGNRVVGGRFSHLRCLGCDYGVAMMGLNWVSSYDDIEATAGPGRSRYGLVSSSSAGSEFRDIRLTGQTIPFLNANGAETMLTNVTVTPSPTSTIYGMVLYYDSAVLNGVNIEASGTSSVWRGAIASIFPWSNLQVQRGHIGNMQNPDHPTAPIVVQRLLNETGSAAAVIQGTSFTGTASAPAVIRVVDAQGNSKWKPTVVLAATKDSDVPWSDDPRLLSLASDPSVPPDAGGLPRFAPGSPVVRGAVAKGTVFDVTRYGAVADGTTDSYAAIQGAVDVACAAQKRGKSSTVFFPIGPKAYVVGKPVLVHCDGVNLEGAQRTGSVIDTKSGGGPALVLSPSSARGLDVVSSLFGGSALKTGDDSSWIDLRDVPGAADLDGLGAFTAEAFVNVRTPSQGYGGIVQSSGCLGSGGALPGCTSAFSLGVTGSALTGSMTVGGKTVSLQGPTLRLGTAYHVALTYDGHTVRLLAGRLHGAAEPVVSAAASGPVSQGLHEDVTVGARTYGFDARVQNTAINGEIGAVRLSKSALYATNYTPPASTLAVDAESTLALLDWSQSVRRGTNEAYATRGYVATYASPVWFPARRAGETKGCAEPKLQGVALRELALDGGVFASNAIKGQYAALALRSSSFGVVLAGDSAESALDDIAISRGTARTGLTVVNGESNVYHHLNIGRVRLPVVIVGGGKQRFNDAFIDTPGATYGSIFIDAGATLEGLYDYNVVDDSIWKGSLVIVNATSPFQLFKGELDNGNASAARTSGSLPHPLAVIVDGGEGVRLVGTSFRTGSTHCAPDGQSYCSTFPAALVHVNAATRQANIAVGVTWDDPRVPLSNDPGRFQSIGN